MKKYFFTGFIALLPIALTLVVVLWLFNLFTEPLVGLAESMILHYQVSLKNHDALILFLSRVFAFALLTSFILFLGFCGQKFLSAFLLKIVDRILSRIPVVRSIYRLSLDVTKALFSSTEKTFKETVLVSFPQQDTLAIGFVMGESPSSLKQKGCPQTDLAIFVPTAPHPMSGFVLLTPRHLVLPVDVSVEDAFKFLISCGVIPPSSKFEKTPDDRVTPEV